MLIPLAADFADVRYIYIAGGGLIFMVMVGYAIYMYFKRWMSQDLGPSGGGFSLSDLKHLHEQGKMSDEEYQMAREKMVASARRMTEKLPEVLPRKPARPAIPQNDLPNDVPPAP